MFLPHLRSRFRSNCPLLQLCWNHDTNYYEENKMAATMQCICVQTPIFHLVGNCTRPKTLKSALYRCPDRKVAQRFFGKSDEPASLLRMPRTCLVFKFHHDIIIGCGRGSYAVHACVGELVVSALLGYVQHNS